MYPVNHTPNELYCVPYISVTILLGDSDFLLSRLQVVGCLQKIGHGWTCIWLDLVIIVFTFHRLNFVFCPCASVVLYSFGHACYFFGSDPVDFFIFSFFSRGHNDGRWIGGLEVNCGWMVQVALFGLDQSLDWSVLFVWI